MSDINKLFNQFRHTLLSLNSIVDEFNVCQRQPRMAQDDKLMPKYEKIRDDILRDIREHAKSLPTFGRVSANYQNYAEKMKELYTKLNTVNSIIDDLKVGKNIDEKRMDSASEFLAESKVDDAGIVIKPETMVSATDTKSSDGYKAFADEDRTILSSEPIAKLIARKNNLLDVIKKNGTNAIAQSARKDVELINQELGRPVRQEALKKEEDIQSDVRLQEEIDKNLRMEDEARKARESIKAKEGAVS